MLFEEEFAKMLKECNASVVNVTMHWNDIHEQYLMKLEKPNIFLQEFAQPELDKGEKSVFDCGSTSMLFKNLSKNKINKYKLIVIPLND